MQDGIPQIKPASIIDPPQIRPQTESPVQETGAVELPKKVKSKKVKRIVRFFLIILVIFGVVGAIGGLLVGRPAYATYKKGLVLVESAKRMKDSTNSQDIAVIRSELQNVKRDLASFNDSFQALGWMRALPKLGAYWNDGNAAIIAGNYAIETGEIVITTIEPYADIIGLTGASSQQSDSPEDTANDRIEFLVQSLEGILPQMDAISEKATKAHEALLTIDPARYPEEFKGRKIRSQLEQVLALSDEAISLLTESKPLIEKAPYLLGMDDTRTYLLLFQNDKELRPTGGFLTAYAVMNVRNGKVSPVSSNDIYNLDSKYRPSIEAPEPIRNYLKGPYVADKNLRLRDMNWSPDFYESMTLFTEEAAKAGVKNIDGIVAVDTSVVVSILNVIGRIGVPGFGNFSTENDPRCNCPQVIYELESFADVEGPVVWDDNTGKIVYAPRGYGNRKEIVGPLMNSVLANTLGQPKEKVPALAQAAWEMVTQKHVLAFFFDPDAQKGAEGFNIAGRIKATDADYLHINDANLGGRKSNLYVTQDVHQTVEFGRDGTATKTVEITYKNTQAHDGWLNSILPNWTRIYVPEGSQLISAEGFMEDAQTYTDLGKTVFAGGFQLRPQGVAKVTVKYTLPMKFTKEYKVLVQKQPGLDKPLYTFTVGKKTDEQLLATDKTFRFGI